MRNIVAFLLGMAVGFGVPYFVSVSTPMISQPELQNLFTVSELSGLVFTMVGFSAGRRTTWSSLRLVFDSMSGLGIGLLLAGVYLSYLLAG